MDLWALDFVDLVLHSSAAQGPSKPNTTTTTNHHRISRRQPIGHIIFTSVRLATKSDIAYVHNLIHQLAAYELLAHHFKFIEASLAATLFDSNTPLPSTPSPSSSSMSPPNPFLAATPTTTTTDNFTLVINTTNLSSRRWLDLFCVCRTTQLSWLWFFIGDLFVREGYQGNELGKMLLAAVAARAAEMGYGRVEWAVQNWNVNAINFHKRMGADVLKDMWICRLSGKALQNYAST